MKSIKKYLRLYPLYLSMAIKTRLNYKADAIVGIIGFILANLASFFSLFLVVQTIPDLYGWDLNMMMFLYGCVLIPKAIDHMFTDNLWTLAGMMVRIYHCLLVLDSQQEVFNIRKEQVCSIPIVIEFRMRLEAKSGHVRVEQSFHLCNNGRFLMRIF